MEIRRAVADDAGRISSLIGSLSHLFMLSPSGEGGEPFFASITSEAIRGRIGADNFRFWVAYEGDSLIGIVALRDNGHLFNLFVAPSHQRQGLGTRLWRLACDSALEHGNPGEFTVNASTNAVPMYQRLGFVQEGVRVEQHGVATVPMRLLLQNSYLNSLPESLETARLLIRSAKPGDGAILHAAVAESYDELKPWLAWVEPLPSLAQSGQNCRAFYAHFLLNQSLVALFFDKASGELVGGSGFNTVNWQLRQFETGYWRRTGWGGKGLMAEGVSALCAHALLRLGASRVYLTCDEQNTASRALAERCGFELEGILRNERLNLQGALRNTCMYARIGTQA